MKYSPLQTSSVSKHENEIVQKVYQLCSSYDAYHKKKFLPDIQKDEISRLMLNAANKKWIKWIVQI